VFRTHRVVEGHEWFLADSSELIRAVRYLGETGQFQQSGDPTDAERSLALDSADVVISEEDVFAIAGAWSLDPMTLHHRHSDAGPGTRAGVPDHSANAHVPTLPETRAAQARPVTTDDGSSKGSS
jgi:hypothetical protein